MPHQRDGPAPRITTPGQGQKDERARLLPLPDFPRNYPARTSSQAHHRVRRRQQDHWRGFAVRLYAPPTTDGAHALYAFLKLAAQRYGLEVGDVQEIHDPK
jgi:hypothetical protein